MRAYQVKFKTIYESEDEEFNGILVYNKAKPEDSFVICACCGGIFPMDEIEKCERYPTWVNFSEEI